MMILFATGLDETKPSGLQDTVFKITIVFRNSNNTN